MRGCSAPTTGATSLPGRRQVARMETAMVSSPSVTMATVLRSAPSSRSIPRRYTTRMSPRWPACRTVASWLRGPTAHWTVTAMASSPRCSTPAGPRSEQTSRSIPAPKAARTPRQWSAFRMAASSWLTPATTAPLPPATTMFLPNVSRQMALRWVPSLRSIPRSRARSRSRNCRR